eukprot:Nitzschia sp. Nitz4//scaffold421_size8708//1956//3476//NITZ4_009119-RA/size8708-augustus-gene-0.2-mRNA-1//1//CDS//3329551565//806//frame0
MLDCNCSPTLCFPEEKNFGGGSFINEDVHIPALEQTDRVLIPLERTNALDPQERNQGLDDLHGVSDSTKESPELMLRLLNEFDREMCVQQESTDAYKQALRMDETYVRSLRIRYLRVADLDAREATARMARHFEFRKKYFGADKLVGDLSLNDLPLEDIHYHKMGFAQVLSERDRSGRAILATCGKVSCEVPIETLVRLLLVYGDVLTRDEDVQKRGVVFIYFAHGQTQYAGSRVATLTQTILAGPMRMVANHICYNSAEMNPLVSLAAYALTTRALLRFRTHYGSVMECLYSLRSFGVPTEAIPIQMDGSWQAPESGNSFLTYPRMSSPLSIDLMMGMNSFPSNGSMADSPSVVSGEETRVEDPLPMDVLMGRGKGGMKSLGNQRLKMLQQDYRERYEKGSRLDKIWIGQTIFQSMSDAGARFLSQADDRSGWIVVSESVAKKSIAHGFRNMRRVAKARKIPGDDVRMPEVFEAL